MRSEPRTKHPGGRPRVDIKPEQVSQLRRQGASWRQVAKALEIGTATAMRLVGSSDEARPNTQHRRPKNSHVMEMNRVMRKSVNEITNTPQMRVSNQTARLLH